MSPLIRSLLVMFVFLAATTNQVRASSPIGECLSNQRHIHQVKQIAAFEEDLSPGDEVKRESLSQTFSGKIPECPTGGSYTIGRVGEMPACSIELHSHEGLRRYLNAKRIKCLILSLFALAGTVAASLFALRFWNTKRPLIKGAWRRKLVILVAGYLISGALLSLIWGNQVSAPIALQLLYLPFVPSMTAAQWL